MNAQPSGRSAHVQWCKDRALRYLDDGDLAGAVASFSSDIEKHPDTAGNPTIGMLKMVGLATAAAGDAAGVRQWVEGFA